MKKKYKIIFISLFVLLLAFFAITKIVSDSKSNLKSLSNLEIQNVNLDKIPDGIYNGTYEIFPISVEVAVIVKSHKIIDINLVKHDNGKGASAEVVTESVINAQSFDVESVSGATYSSKAILKAIENALSNYWLIRDY